MNSSSTTPPPPAPTTVNGEQTSTQLIIKAQFGDDIRKMMIHNEELTLNELILMMERIFAGKISNSDEINIKYLDDDGDKITLLNDTDLTVALHFHKLLRLFVFVNGQEQAATSSGNASETNEKSGNLVDAKTFRSELQQIRNAVQTILDRLQLPAETSQEKEVSSSSATAPPVAQAPPTNVSSTTREFDPIKNATHFQPPQQRSSTPDSIRSKSSTSHLSEQKTFVPNNAAPTETVEQQQQHHAPPTATFGQPQVPPQQHFVPPSFVHQPNNDQALKNNAFGPPPTSGFPGLVNAPPRFPMTSAPPSAFNPNPTPPPPTATATQLPGQQSSFIGQQQQHQQQPPLAGPPQHQPGAFYSPQAAAQQQQQQQAPPTQTPGGFFQQQAAHQQQRPPGPGFAGFNQPPAGFPQPLAQPPPSSSPATITPSSMQPPPMASHQPYGYPPQNYYGQPAQYPKAT